MGAERVIGIDRLPERLRMAREHIGSETINYEEVDSVLEVLKEMTGGRGPDACIDAVGMEAHGYSVDAFYDKVKTLALMETERPHVIRQAINCCRKGGTVSIPGVYGGVSDKIPIGAMMNKGLTIKTGQTHVHRYVPELLDFVRQGRIDPSFVVTHRIPLSEAPHGYRSFREKRDQCIKVVRGPAA